MRYRQLLLFAAGAGVVILAVLWVNYRVAGFDEVRAVTTRVARAVEHGDANALATEQLMGGQTADWFLKHREVLRRGYRVEVCRNGDDGYELMSREVVTHLGRIRTTSGCIHLGFRYDRTTERLEFVTASLSTFLTISPSR